MGNAILRFGSRLRDVFVVLLICRFSVLTLLTGIGFLLVAPQGQEVLRAMADRSPLGWLPFLVATLLWAAGGWYWSRSMLSFRYPDWPPADDPNDPGRSAYVQTLHQWVPRTISGLSSLTVFLAIVLASVPFSAVSDNAEHSRAAQQRLWLLAVCSLLVMVGFQWFVHRRRKWFPSFFPEDEHTSPPFGSWASITDVPRGTRIALAVSLVFVVACFVVFTIRPVTHVIAPALGAATIVLLAAAAWVPAGSVAVHIGNRGRFPVLLLLLALLALCSLNNDNHGVRILADHPDAAVTKGTVHAYFDSWLKARRDGSAGSTSASAGKVPVFIVAADGGGIRAGYWTALVLAGVQDRYPSFARSVFVISGVSGGSLGAAVFAALVSADEQGEPPQCAKGGDPTHKHSRCVDEMLSHDFLSPTLATMLYPDLVQRFLPFAIPYFDRATTLEEAFERGWTDTTRSDRFSQAFASLWTGNAAYRVPALILNGTSVEQGRRLLTTNLPALGEAEKPEFLDFDDARGILKYDVRVSTAVNNSARFTYVSPAGRLAEASHIVDGGYFENAGATSAAEALGAADPNRDTVVPVVIHIVNDPEAESSAKNRSNNAASETLTPVLALLNTRTARGVYATEALRRDVESRNGHFLEFKLYDRGVPLPLGWSLASSATHEMQSQLARDFACDADNAKKLREVLGEPAIPCSAK